MLFAFQLPADRLRRLPSPHEASPGEQLFVQGGMNTIGSRIHAVPLYTCPTAYSSNHDTHKQHMRATIAKTEVGRLAENVLEEMFAQLPDSTTAGSL